MRRIIYIALFFIFGITLSHGQCYPDRHSTNWYDGWVSCEPSTNPNSIYGESHWIMYDLGQLYALTESKLWNANEPANLDFGIQEFHVDYSIDGEIWENLGQFTLDQGNGLSTYEGTDGPDFGEVFAKYVLITPTSNYGGDCYAFSELKINIGDESAIIDEEDGFSVLVYPNPFISDLNLKIVTLFEGESIAYQLYDILGRQILSESVEQATLINNIDLSRSDLASGLYILNVQHNGKDKTFKLIRR